MPLLKCSATTCSYNKEKLCTKGDIMVSGADAKYPDETSCASFREKGTESALNACGGEGCRTIEVDCKACECTYNTNEKCTAAAIDIAGAHADTSSDTKCGTFSCR